MKKVLLMVVLVLTVAVLAACGASESKDNTAANNAAATGEVKEFTVKASNFKFEPVEIKVNKGDTVKITLENAEGFHGLAIPEYKVDVQGGKTVEFVADKTGSFEFVCSIMCGSGHADMKGTLVVE